MAVNQFNLKAGQRAERKLLITVAEWTTDTPVDTYYAQTSEPADWATNYTDYYTKSGDTYVAVPAGTGVPTWEMYTYYTKVTTNVFREILGTRTEDSSIEYNPDIQESTDILGNNYTDVNKTQPSQAFDPFLILGGSRLGAFLNDIRRRNALSELQQFTIYVITAFVGSSGAYETEKHTDCSITYDSIGGDANVNFPITVHFSNKITTGTVDKIAPDFVFTADASI